MDMKQNELLQRGNKLWEMKFVLPEHKKELVNWKEEQNKVSRPQLDEQELLEIERKLIYSLYHHEPLQIVYWEDGYLHETITVIMQIEYQQKRIRCKNKDGILAIQIEQLKQVDV
ncbi:YolD-like family protein [Halalkalibacter sp. APA_J-10(15)]|uniref:YolD-like family protein n=1 Tax=unclassified Halalkalibacter TaxID=2893063 RepID=UPI001FF49960|nr:YolD-like family protein [Halalkalibacter sp. APA_J-10(15)]MCK0472217.1 YolD-like family protein [Halalkalibacter sp. APA_J-10(15)]